MPRTNLRIRAKQRPRDARHNGAYNDLQNKLAYDATRAAYGSRVHEQRLYDQGYALDTEISGERDKVFYDPTGEMKPIVAFRGTQDITDIGADVELGLGHYRGVQFQRAKSLLAQSESRYGKGVVTGHSLGGTKAIVAGRSAGHEVVAFNPGTGLFPLEAGDSVVFNTTNDIINKRIHGTNVYFANGGHSSDNFEVEFGEERSMPDWKMVPKIPEVGEIEDSKEMHMLPTEKKYPEKEYQDEKGDYEEEYSNKQVGQDTEPE